MRNNNRNTNRHDDWQDEYSEGRSRNDRGHDDGYYDRNSRGTSRSRRDDGYGYNDGASRSGYGSSMSSQGGGTGSFYPTEGYQDSRYPDQGSYRDHRRYPDNYRDDHYDRGNEYGRNDSRRFNEESEQYYRKPAKAQSYDSAYNNRSYGNHMGYGEKGAQYRDDFSGRYGEGRRGGYNQSDRGYSRNDYERGTGNNQGYTSGRDRMGSSSYFVNTRSDAYNGGGDDWNIGNYGERRTNEYGYGFDDDRDQPNDRNYTW